MYRLTALAALRQGLALEDEPAVAAVAASLDVEFVARSGASPGILLAGEEVGERIRGEDCGAAASRVAALPAVRAALLQRQRDFRRAPGLVADGRDMGTVVFPNAELKLFLTASPEERAGRRYKQLSEKGIDASLDSLVHEIAARDARDAGRAVAPLRPAADAQILDTTQLDIPKVCDWALEWTIRRLGLMENP